MTNLLKEYIQRKQIPQTNNPNIHPIIGSVCLYVISEPNQNINIDEVVSQIRNSIPTKLISVVDGVYIAEIREFKERQINALFKDGCIYVTGNQDSTEDLLDDIVHEFAHAIEESYEDLIYKDGTLEKEFLTKRSEFWDRLGSDQPNNKKLLWHLLDPEFSEELDEFFYHTLGYEKIGSISGDMFCSPYGITSLREYWANSFEHFLMGESELVGQICPIAFSKIQELLETVR